MEGTNKHKKWKYDDDDNNNNDHNKTREKVLRLSLRFTLFFINVLLFLSLLETGYKNGRKRPGVRKIACVVTMRSFTEEKSKNKTGARTHTKAKQLAFPYRLKCINKKKTSKNPRINSRSSGPHYKEYIEPLIFPLTRPVPSAEPLHHIHSMLVKDVGCGVCYVGTYKKEIAQLTISRWLG